MGIDAVINRALLFFSLIPPRGAIRMTVVPGWVPRINGGRRVQRVIITDVKVRKVWESQSTTHRGARALVFSLASLP